MEHKHLKIPHELRRGAYSEWCDTCKNLVTPDHFGPNPDDGYDAQCEAKSEATP